MEKKEEVISFNREILNNPKIRAFAISDGDKVTYVISLDSNDKVQKHQDRIALAKLETGKLRILKQKIITLLKLIADGKAEKSTIDFSIEQLKKDGDISLTPEMLEILSICTDKDKRNLEQISVKRENKIEEMIPDSDIDYKKLESKLPVKETLDLSQVPKDILQDLGANVQNRLNTLNSIESAEGVMPHQYSLESFMMSQEVGTDREKILLKFIEKIDELDPDTIIATLKAIEDADIKYSKLYPIYLRIQEKRIITKVQMYLIGLKSREDVPTGQLEKFLEMLDNQKIEDLTNTDINRVISGFIGKENNDVAEYIKDGRKIDFEMLRYINSQEESGERAEQKEEVVTYLKNRIASLRQVGKDFEKFELRSYIEDTDFKDLDETEQKQFLYKVAEMEKKYLLKRYNEITSNKYKENQQSQPHTLEEYNQKLTRTEHTKEQHESLYDLVNQLFQDAQNKTNPNHEVGENEING
ncbi:MAG: hypothetical protein HFJ47_03560 [Clostridia bacterium]|nr:hypothetical protein [Clostridia bacterium]